MTHGNRSFPRPLLSVLLACMPWSYAIVCGETGPSSSAEDSSRLSVRIEVLLPDGSPAAKARVHAYDALTLSTRTITTDQNGRCSLDGHFLSGLKLHAVSDDGRSQAVLVVPEAEVRSFVSRPITIQTGPTREHRVVVTANGQPVEGARIVVGASVAMQQTVTQRDGSATVRYPQAEKVRTVVAWHPKLGATCTRYRGTSKPGPTTQLSLLEPKQHTIRLVDDQGDAVVGCVIAPDALPADGNWTRSSLIDAARAKTDDKGEVRFDWFPAGELKAVDVQLFDDRWKKDHVDRDKTHLGLTIVRVRKEFPVEGRVVFPDDIDAAGMLITGYGFGVGSFGDLPRTRLRKDGTFGMRVPAGHGFVIGLSDLDWASDIWTGMIVPVEGEPQNEIELRAYPATPLEVRVTRGDSRDPVSEASVSVSRRGRVQWTDEQGQSRTGSAGLRNSVLSDEAGRVQTSVGLGEVRLRLSSGDWSEEKTIEVTSRDPVEVEFHRAWAGSRIVKARPSVDGKDYMPSTDAVALAWTERSRQIDKVHNPTISKDGQVKVAFDEEELSVLLLDRKQHRSGFAKAGVNDEVVELPMLGNASYSGTLLDRLDDAPLADRTVRIMTDSSFLDVVEPTQTDDQGRFTFADIAAGVPLRLIVKNEPGRPNYALFDGERLFEAGEIRTGDVARAALMDGNRAVSAAKPKRSIAERFEIASSNARAMGMHTIVLIEGDDSSRTKHVSGRLRNNDEVEAISRYMVVLVTADHWKQADQSLAAVNWPQPGPDELVMVVPARDEKEPAVLRLDCSNTNAALESGSTFIEQHMPEDQDGRDKLQQAQRAAAQTDRMLWVIAGGPRCAPCIRLARWIENHRDVLDKDLVVLKLTAGLDQHADEIRKQIGGEGHGIPFHVLMSGAGDVEWSSEGPLGNIGMPSSVEGIRHFQTMLQSARQRMTPAEIRQLTDSLAQQD